MAGEQTRMLWALVYVVGLLATHYLVGQGSLTDTMAMWVWFVLVIISNYSIGRTYGKVPAAVSDSWMGASVLFIVLVGTMLLGLWAGGSAVLWAIYLFLMGGANFASGHEMKKGTWMGWGLTSIAFGLVFTSWFGTFPYLAAALIIGVPMLFATWKKIM